MCQNPYPVRTVVTPPTHWTSVSSFALLELAVSTLTDGVGGVRVQGRLQLLHAAQRPHRPSEVTQKFGRSAPDASEGSRQPPRGGTAGRKAESTMRRMDEPTTPGASADVGDQDDATAVELTDTETAVLELEKSWWKHPARKEAVVYDKFGWSMTRYYQVLTALMDNPAALAADPVTVNRLRRLRQERQRARYGR